MNRKGFVKRWQWTNCNTIQSFDWGWGVCACEDISHSIRVDSYRCSNQYEPGIPPVRLHGSQPGSIKLVVVAVISERCGRLIDELQFRYRNVDEQ
jgi:hypothetical protein